MVINCNTCFIIMYYHIALISILNHLIIITILACYESMVKVTIKQVAVEGTIHVHQDAQCTTIFKLVQDPGVLKALPSGFKATCPLGSGLRYQTHVILACPCVF